MAGRRELSFASLDAVMPEVDRLRAGHEAAGTWSLAQICRHLSVALDLTTRSAALMRNRGPRAEATPEQAAARDQFFAAARIPEGVPTPSARLDPPPGLDDRAEAEALRGALARFAATPGPFGPHPLLGPLADADWARFHCIHCAHHLGFARPAGESRARS